MSARALRRGGWVRRVVALVMAAWALGLGVATLQLDGWQRALTEVLVQMRADALVRASAARTEAVQPEWHRRRALALIDAVERLHDDQWWTWVMPGSWRVFDDLEERATRQVASAFSEVVVVTMRRELQARGARLAGTTAQGPGQACQAPRAPGAAPGGETLEITQMAEFVAMQGLVEDARGLDRAVAALRGVRQGGPAASAQLRELVRYSLGAELSHPASRSLALFRATPDPQDPQFEALTAQLQWQLRCTAIQGMAALQARLVEDNPLLEAEAGLSRTLQPGLFAPGTDGAWPDAGRLRQAIQRVNDTQSLLSAGEGDWMAPGSAGFGQGHGQLLQAMAQVALMGPPVAGQLQAQAAADHARLASRVQAQLGRRGSMVDWHGLEGRFALAPRAVAARAGLVALLETPFMAVDAAPATREQDLVALEEQRQVFEREGLPRFPASLRAPAQAYVQARIEALSRQALTCLAMGTPGCEANPKGTLQAPLQEPLQVPTVQEPPPLAPGLPAPWGSEGAGEAPASSGG